MATTPQPIEAAIAASATDLYTAFVAGGATRAMIVSLDLTNTTAADITVDVWLDIGGAVTRYLADDLVVPAKGTASWRGMAVLNASSEKLRAQGSATGVDAVGAVMENA